MQKENQYDRIYESDSQSMRERRLLAKFEVKPYHVEYKNMYILAMASSGIFQLLSIATAVTLPASWWHKVFHNWGIGFLIAGVLLIGLEILKRIMVGKSFKNYFQFKKRLGLYFAAVPSILSIAASVIGTPILIKNFGATPTLADTSTVIANYDQRITTQVAFWQAKQAEAEQKADDIHRQNNWKDVTVKDARDDVLAERNRASSYGDSVTTIKPRLEAERDAAVDQMLADNEALLLQDAKDKEHAGMMLGIVTLFFELLFLLSLAWCERYDYRERIYIESQKKVIVAKMPKVAQKVEESTEIVEDSDDLPSGSEQAGDRRQIGFAVAEGTIRVNDKGTPVIAYEKERGGIKWYRYGQLTSQINDALKTYDKTKRKTYKDRADRLQRLQNQLKDAIEIHG